MLQQQNRNCGARLIKYLLDQTDDTNHNMHLSLHFLFFTQLFHFTWFWLVDYLQTTHAVLDTVINWAWISATFTSL